MHTKAQGVQRSSQTTDGTALTSSIPALKANNGGDLRLKHFNLQQLETLLVLVQLLFVILLRQLLSSIDFAQNIVLIIGANHCSRCCNRSINGLFHRLHNGGDDFYFRTTTVIC